MGLFDREIVNGKKQVPVWFMRQAGRYHDHYQGIRAKNSFYDLCKNPELALEVTMGPINDFNFDAAILFSDLLFPLEHLGLGLSYETGKPTLDKRLETLDDVKALTTSSSYEDYYSFQKKACELIRHELPANKNLIGFVGAPFTLFAYGVYGTHAGSLVNAKTGLYDGRFDLFCEKLIPGILVEMDLQVQGGADTVAIFDTAVGEFSLPDFKRFILPKLRMITKEFKKKHPSAKIIYYSKFTSMNHLDAIEDENIDVLGVDYRHNLADVLTCFSDDYMIQGNIDPCWLHLPWQNLKGNIDELIDNVLDSNANLDRWICGLGHGVLPKTPQENVRMAVEHIHNRLQY